VTALPSPRAPAVAVQLEEIEDPGPLAHETTLADLALGAADLSGGRARSVSVRASRLRGTSLSGAEMEGLELTDDELRGCDLANLRAHHGSWMRVSAETCRMTGLSVVDSLLRDVVVRDCRIDLASFGGCRLQRVTFEDCHMEQTDFLEAELDTVRFLNCELGQLDLRGARMRRCEMRDNRMEAIQGVQSLAGVRMPWTDIIGAAALWAGALGIEELDEDDS
jgi:uncharacterized protein YjbI with pentapeptide repeats